MLKVPGVLQAQQKTLQGSENGLTPDLFATASKVKRLRRAAPSRCPRDPDQPHWFAWYSAARPRNTTCGYRPVSLSQFQSATRHRQDGLFTDRAGRLRTLQMHQWHPENPVLHGV